MSNNIILNSKYNKISKIFKIIGPLLLVTGFIGVLIAISLSFSLIKTEEIDAMFIAIPFWIFGILFTFIGLFLTGIGYMTSFMASQIAPVAKDTANYMIEGTSNSIGKTLSNYKKHLEEIITCPNCGYDNDYGNNFCNCCGEQLIKECPYCGSYNEMTNNFCNECGHELD